MHCREGEGDAVATVHSLTAFRSISDFDFGYGSLTTLHVSVSNFDFYMISVFNIAFLEITFLEITRAF